MPSLPNIFWGVLALGGALSGYTYGLTSVNNSCKKAIRPAVFYSNILKTNTTTSTNSINIVNIHYSCISWYSQQHRTQSYNENIADLNLSISVTLSQISTI